MELKVLYAITLLFFGYPLSAALMCSQCYSMTVRNQSNMDPLFNSVAPSLFSPQCGAAYHSAISTTPQPMVVSNQQPVLPTTCQITAVAGTNTEIRCGFYKGFIDVTTHNGEGKASLSVFSMTCFNVDVNVEWPCKVREFPVPGDTRHFDLILQNKFRNLLKLTRFVGSVCYCHRADCTDAINGSSATIPSIAFTLLLSFLVLFRKFYI
ncbi:uncharacterized protein LOC133205328 [Saccostrea echinata]|uniref:uncharacterized protein LOC133205328 n=1 Tax=Saccostrea echinata TaxID=191078 RepID=UPI002A83F093|nr:uncharacterized protein LOC133205328 [Saccostrea echinata]